MVIEKGWSGFTLGQSGTKNRHTVWFKHVKYDLTKEKTIYSHDAECIYIYNPKMKLAVAEEKNVPVAAEEKKELPQPSKK